MCWTCRLWWSTTWPSRPPARVDPRLTTRPGHPGQMHHSARCTPMHQDGPSVSVRTGGRAVAYYRTSSPWRRTRPRARTNRPGPSANAHYRLTTTPSSSPWVAVNKGVVVAEPERDVLVVAGLLGHASLEVTRTYTRPTDRDLAAAVEAGAVEYLSRPVRTPGRPPAGPGWRPGHSRTALPRHRRARPPPARRPGTVPGPHSPGRWRSRPAGAVRGPARARRPGGRTALGRRPGRPRGPATAAARPLVPSVRPAVPRGAPYRPDCPAVAARSTDDKDDHRRFPGIQRTARALGRGPYQQPYRRARSARPAPTAPAGTAAGK